MKRVQQGFTLIELMIVVAIVGILAAIALPAYQDYIIRSKMSEAEAAIAACKTSVAEFVSSRNAWPADETTVGCSTSQTQYVASLTVTAGPSVITATSRNTGAKPGECVMTLTAQGTPPEITGWAGSNTGACDVKYLPSVFR